MKLIYIGKNFYRDSQTAMSPIVEEKTFERSDWGYVEIALQQRKKVSIRPANKKEMKWAEKELARIKKALK